MKIETVPLRHTNYYFMITKTNLAIIASSVFLSFNSFAQLPKISKPKLNVEVPKIGGGNVTASDVGLGGKDASGLFSNVTNDPSADAHRKNAVTALQTLEAEYQKSSVDYDAMTKLMFENERELGYVMKLEPKVDRSKYDARYLPLKERADKELAIYAELVKQEAMFEKSFRATAEMQKPDPLTFRTDAYSAHKQCYCHEYYADDSKTYSDYEAAKKSYDENAAKLVGYKNAETQKIFANMASCLTNGNAYAVWVAKDNLNTAVVEYAKTNKPSQPKRVITRCEEYTAAIDRVEKDHSLNLDAISKAALTEAKAAIAKIKTDAETYISSGQFQKYQDQVHAAEIAKVFLPKAVTKNATLEAGAMTYVKGTEYNEYLKRNSESMVATTVRAVTLTKEAYVKKNEWGLPLYEYHEMWVAYKGKDGKCYMCAVYASYTYKGGGVYATVPTWGADLPEEMACDNLMK